MESNAGEDPAEGELNEGTTEGVGLGFKMETILVLVFKDAGLNWLVDPAEGEVDAADLCPYFPPRLFLAKDESASRGGGSRKVASEEVGNARGSEAEGATVGEAVEGRWRPDGDADLRKGAGGDEEKADADNARRSIPD